LLDSSPNGALCWPSGEHRLRDLGVLQIGVGEADRVAGEIDLDPVVPPFERGAFEADAGAAEAGAVIVIVAALRSTKATVIGLDHAARLEGEVAGRVGDGRAPGELRRLGRARFDGLEAALVELRLLLELGIARLELRMRASIALSRSSTGSPVGRGRGEGRARHPGPASRLGIRRFGRGQVLALLGEGGRGEGEGEAPARSRKRMSVSVYEIWGGRLALGVFEDLVEQAAVVEVVGLRLLPAAEIAVDREQLHVREARLVLGRDLRVARPVIILGDDLLRLGRVEIFEIGLGDRRVPLRSTTLSTTATGGSARIETDGTTMSNLPGRAR
jgi:hypothetical protein